MSKTVKLVISALFFVFTFGSCDKNEIPFVSDNTTTTFKAELKGLNEVPSNPSSAIGVTILTYNNMTKEFTETTTFSGLTPISGHIHMAANGANGYSVFPFSNDFIKLPILQREAYDDKHEEALLAKKMHPKPYLVGYDLMSPNTFQSSVLTLEQIEALFEGRMYVDLHSIKYPEGEIRGQLIKQ